jgi:hypothetical protein
MGVKKVCNIDIHQHINGWNNTWTNANQVVPGIRLEGKAFGIQSA